jgi:hypothetical protein
MPGEEHTSSERRCRGGLRRLTWSTLGVWAVVLLAACSSTSRTSTAPSPTGTSPGSPPPSVSAAPTPTATSPSPSPSPSVKPAVKPTGSPKSTPAPAPALTTPAASPSSQAVVENGTLAVADANDGQTVTLHPGDHLRVVLSSTYWQFQPSSDPSVLRPEGSPATSPSPGCVPGAGCGTAAATFTALSPGHATIVATRTSCGEAMLCQGSAGHYQIDVVVAS